MNRYAKLLILTAAPLLAQANRESYRVPYQAWRDAAPTLEQDAATPNPEFAARVQATAQAAEKFLAARADYINAARADATTQTDWASKPLVHSEAMLTPRAEVQTMLTRANEFLNTTIGNFANVKDPAIQQVRQAMERERAALTALNQTLTARQPLLRDLTDNTSDADALRATVSQALKNASATREQLALHVRNEATAWTTYYRDLAEGAASTARTSSNSGSPTSPAKPTALVQRASPAGQTPLSRYVGAWSYPARNGIFLGVQPQTVELLVREDGGKLTGTLVAKFLIPAGTSGDSNLRFDFQGPIQQTRKQTFPLMTPEGVTGTIELIPGSAINLLEVNFQTGANGNKFRTANFVLLKR